MFAARLMTLGRNFRQLFVFIFFGVWVEYAKGHICADFCFDEIRLWHRSLIIARDIDELERWFAGSKVPPSSFSHATSNSPSHLSSHAFRYCAPCAKIELLKRLPDLDHRWSRTSTPIYSWTQSKTLLISRLKSSSRNQSRVTIVSLRLIGAGIGWREESCWQLIRIDGSPLVKASGAGAEINGMWRVSREIFGRAAPEVITNKE